MLRVFAIAAALVLAGCASQPLTHNYQGDVHLQTIRIDVEPLRDGADEAQSGDLGALTKLQKLADSLDKAMDPEEQKKVEAQLKEFEQILVQGIRQATGIPLVASEDADINMVYNDNAELSEVRFTYKKFKGATMDLYGNIYYGSKSETTLGGKLMNTKVYEVKPVLNLQIDARNRKDKPFWQTYVSYRSKEEFRLSNAYIMGITPDEIENSDIFLIPLAKGVVKEIHKDVKKKK
ncbi:hypothetical protein [Oceanospirillum sanctuarii]|uniref:hypothetical protein n=1 Tax=Oceanospirillum sanctuarii TaxID=1434821 RepID=UPI000A3C82ED|nr:hypothetical protein [Oceanospirillum sanctuarii]